MQNKNEQQVLESFINPNLVELVKSIVKQQVNEISALKEHDTHTMPIQTQEITLLTIKECTKLIPGISDYTVRELIQRGDVEYFRTGQGKSGKILVYKQSFINYFLNKGGVA